MNKLQISKKAWYQNNKTKIKARSKKYYYDNKCAVLARCAAWKKANNISPKYRLNDSISASIRYVLKSNKNGRHWETLVGYTLEQLIKHLEKQFKTGMTWENYGINGWHIDHKIPKSVFNFTKPEHRDFKRCWALSNLQPMWGVENISKSNKIAKHFQPSLLI